MSSNDFSNLETLVKGIVKEKQPFERLEITKENLLKMFEVSSVILPLLHSIPGTLHERRWGRGHCSGKFFLLFGLFFFFFLFHLRDSHNSLWVVLAGCAIHQSWT